MEGISNVEGEGVPGMQVPKPPAGAASKKRFQRVDATLQRELKQEQLRKIHVRLKAASYTAAGQVLLPHVTYVRQPYVRHASDICAT